MLNATIEEEIYILEPVPDTEEDIVDLPTLKKRGLSRRQKVGIGVAALLGVAQIAAAYYGVRRLAKRLRG